MDDRATRANGDQANGAGGMHAAAGPDLAGELARARERLAFYEGFDRLIQENIARSGDLLRQAAEQREAAIREVSQARAELDRRRDEQRTTLTLLAEELLGLQRQVGALTQRVMAAIDDLGTIPAAASPNPEAVISPPSPVAPTSTAPTEPPLTPESPVTTTAAPVGTVDVTDPGVSPPPLPPLAPIHDELAAEPTDGELPETARTVAPTEDEPTTSEVPRAVSVVVHGVPRAAAALALQRHLHGLAHVEAVEAREYAAGVLRLQVHARAPLALDDLRGWEGASDLEPVNVLADVIEVKLPGAAGP